MARKGYVKKFIKKEKQSAGEPNVELIKSNSDLARALYWYTKADISDKKKKAWFLEYAKEAKLDVKAAKRINEKWFNCTLVHSIRLKMNGFNDERSDEYIAKNLPALMARAPKPEKKAAVVEAPKTNKPTIQDRIAAQVSPILAEIDYFHYYPPFIFLPHLQL